MKDKGTTGSGGSGHPLPDSAEAREREIPEPMVQKKGGDPGDPPVEPKGERVAPDGTAYKI